MNELRIESADKNIPGKNKNQSKQLETIKNSRTTSDIKRKSKKEYKKSKETTKVEGYRILPNRLDTECKHQVNFEKR